jgi:hypothetical protein
LVIALIAAAFVGLGLAVRVWWAVGIACLPSLLWLLFWLPRWGADEGDGMTGADWFLLGFVVVGLPLIASVAVGVLVGRLAFGPPGPKQGGPASPPGAAG